MADITVGYIGKPALVKSEEPVREQKDAETPKKSDAKAVKKTAKK